LKSLSIPATIFLTTGYIETSKIFWWDKAREIIMKTTQPAINLKIFQSFLNKEIIEPSYIQLNTNNKKKVAINTITALFKTFENGRIQEATKVLQDILIVSDYDIKVPSILTWKQINEMGTNEIDFGAHTITHQILSKISSDEAKEEIVLSKKLIEEKTKKLVKGLAFPYGFKEHYNSQIIEHIKSVGFHYSCSAEIGCISLDSSTFTFKRISMSNSLPLSLWKLSKYIY
jgi:peptidoglycan/xylan/chitin deacetylase (PgdA/CDA1 family)